MGCAVLPDGGMRVKKTFNFAPFSTSLTEQALSEKGAKTSARFGRKNV